MSWHVPTMGQSSQLRPSCVPSGRSKALMERTRGSERSCLWKRAALFCFLASLFGSWKSIPALPPFLFFPTAALESSMFLGEEFERDLQASQRNIDPHFVTPSRTEIHDEKTGVQCNLTVYRLPLLAFPPLPRPLSPPPRPRSLSLPRPRAPLRRDS